MATHSQTSSSTSLPKFFRRKFFAGLTTFLFLSVLRTRFPKKNKENGDDCSGLESTSPNGERAIGPISGSASSSQRQNIAEEFQSSITPLALVGQIQAAGTGLNIQAASVVILCEPQIKPSLEVQAIARAHRMGQVRMIQVHRLILPDSVDEQMLAMLASKQTELDDYARDSNLANSAVGAKEVSEESIARVIVMEERKRLALDTSARLKKEAPEEQ